MPSPKQHTQFSIADLARQHNAWLLVEQWIRDGRGVAVYRLHGQVTFFSFPPGVKLSGVLGYYDPQEWM